jgi:hypothetical protein
VKQISSFNLSIVNESPSERIDYGLHNRKIIDQGIRLMSCKEAIGYAKFNSRSHHAVIRVYDEAGNVNATHEHAGDFKER